MRPQHPNHIWSVDFVHDKLSNGRPYKMLTVLDEYTREALCVAVKPVRLLRVLRIRGHERFVCIAPCRVGIVSGQKPQEFLCIRKIYFLRSSSRARYDGRHPAIDRGDLDRTVPFPTRPSKRSAEIGSISGSKPWLVGRWTLYLPDNGCDGDRLTLLRDANPHLSKQVGNCLTTCNEPPIANHETGNRNDGWKYPVECRHVTARKLFQ